MRGWLRQAPPTGIAVKDTYLASYDFDPNAFFMNICGVLRGMYDDDSYPFLRLRPAGQGRGTLVRKELDIDISVLTGSTNNPLVMGEVAYRNEDLDHHIRALATARCGPLCHRSKDFCELSLPSLSFVQYNAQMQRINYTGSRRFSGCVDHGRRREAGETLS
jgi:hypothetical protein